MPLHEARTDVLRIRISDQFLPLAANALCWGVALLRLARFTVQLLQLCLVDLIPEGPFYRTQVGTVTIASELNAITQTAHEIQQKRPSSRGIAISENPTRYELRVSSPLPCFGT